MAVIANSFIMLWTLWLTARSANRADERYRNLVEMSPDALFVYRDGRIGHRESAFTSALSTGP